MTENEIQTIDLVVGPLENFDEAVAFGDALYGLDGVTRLALNEFEGNRASFTFTARSLRAVSESLSRLVEFPVAAVERAVDGTLQVRLGGGPAATAPEHVPQGFEPQEPVPAPSTDPFVREAPLPEPPAEDVWAAGTPIPAADSGDEVAPAPVTVATDASLLAFEGGSAETSAAAETFTHPADAWSTDSEPEVVPAEGPTPLFPGIEPAFVTSQQEDPGAEVARVIEKLASELRETAEHLAQLAAGITPATSNPAGTTDASEWPAPSPSPDTPDLPWNQDVASARGGSTQYDLPPVLTTEELDGIAASESWTAESQTAMGTPAPSAAEAETAKPAIWAATDAVAGPSDQREDEPEQKGWEAPRMPAVGAMAPIQGSDTATAEFKTEAQNAQAIALATAMGKRPSQVQLMASGFASFGIANSFIAAIRQIQGVRNVAIAELDQGRLKLTLDYFGSDSLEVQLQQLRDFPHQVVRASGKEIEIQLMAA
jgi:hypothetical protein